jgi:hypothetical protein
VQAIQAHHRVNLRYRAQTGDVTERMVDPYQAVHRAGRWYLVGYCHLRADQRVFRLDHIQRALELPETFTPTAIDAVAAVERAIAQAPWRWEFEALAAMPLAELRQRIPATLATLRPQEGGVLLHGFADDLDWVAYMLAGLRCPIVIVRPAELRASLLALADRIRAIAEPSVNAHSLSLSHEAHKMDGAKRTVAQRQRQADDREDQANRRRRLAGNLAHAHDAKDQPKNAKDQPAARDDRGGNAEDTKNQAGGSHP